MSLISEPFQSGYKIPYQRQAKGLDPGHEHKLSPTPIDDITADGKQYKAALKLEGRRAIITGADSGIGRAVAILFGKTCCDGLSAGFSCELIRSSSVALEGADLTLHGTPAEEVDLKDTVELIEQRTHDKRKITSIALDLRDEEECKTLVQAHLDFHGGQLDTL